MTQRKASKRVLSIDLTVTGFAFAVLEGPMALREWGNKWGGRSRRTHVIHQLGSLLARIEPDVVVLEDATRSRRKVNTKDLILDLAELARPAGCEVVFVCRSQIRKALASTENATHYDIATIIAERFPEIAHRMPPPRKPWKSEDARLRIFTSVALALAYYTPKKKDGQ